MEAIHQLHAPAWVWKHSIRDMSLRRRKSNHGSSAVQFVAQSPYRLRHYAPSSVFVKLINTITPILYALTPWSRVLREKPTCPKLLKKFPAFYRTRRFITAFTAARHLSLFSARSIQSMPSSHFSKIRLNIILPSMPASSKWSPFLRFPRLNPVCPIRAARLVHLSHFYFIARVTYGEDYRA